MSFAISDREPQVFAAGGFSVSLAVGASGLWASQSGTAAPGGVFATGPPGSIHRRAPSPRSSTAVQVSEGSESSDSLLVLTICGCSSRPRDDCFAEFPWQNGLVNGFFGPSWIVDTRGDQRFGVDRNSCRVTRTDPEGRRFTTQVTDGARGFRPGGLCYPRAVTAAPGDRAWVALGRGRRAGTVTRVGTRSGDRTRI